MTAVCVVDVVNIFRLFSSWGLLFPFAKHEYVDIDHESISQAVRAVFSRKSAREPGWKMVVDFEFRPAPRALALSKQ